MTNDFRNPEDCKTRLEMTPKVPGKLKSNCPEFPYKCDICDRPRSQGNHQKCSKIRQARNRGEE